MADFRCFRTGRCHIPGKLRPPGCPHGYGPGGPRCVEQVHDFQPQEPQMGQPRPLRPLVRTSLYFSTHTMAVMAGFESRNGSGVSWMKSCGSPRRRQIREHGFLVVSRCRRSHYGFCTRIFSAQIDCLHWRDCKIPRFTRWKS